jgi:purine-nucleoside phosphorylase
VSSSSPFETAQRDAETIASRTGVGSHHVAVVLGSGWTAVADALGKPEVEVPFSDLGGFPRPTVPGHAGAVRSLVIGDRRVLVFAGRVHLYEGHDPATVVHGVRTAVLAGCRTVVLTNAAGAIRTDLGVGQPVLISDHLNLTGRNPLAGPPPPEPFASRFVDVSEAYSPRLRALAREVDPALAEGVYAGLLGPTYETPAEIRMLQAVGADLVGMSTVLETLAARHLGAEVLGITLVTNLAAGLAPAPLAHDEVVEAARQNMDRVTALLRGVLERV